MSRLWAQCMNKETRRHHDRADGAVDTPERVDAVSERTGYDARAQEMAGVLGGRQDLRTRR